MLFCFCFFGGGVVEGGVWLVALVSFPLERDLSLGEVGWNGGGLW